MDLNTATSKRETASAPQFVSARFNLRTMAIEVSTVLAAIFAAMTYVGQKDTDALLAHIQANTQRNAAAASDMLEQSVGHLRLLDRILPEAERSRHGIEALVVNAEKQLKAFRASELVGDARSPSSPRRNQQAIGMNSAPKVESWWSLGDLNDPLNKNAKKIWEGAGHN